MPVSVSRAIMAILFLAAVGGWAATATLILTVAAPAGEDEPALVNRVETYVKTYVEVEAGGALYERVLPYVTGSALESLRAEQAAGAAPIPGLKIDGPIKASILWRYGDQALAEVVFNLRDEAGTASRVAEHLLLVLRDGFWKVDTIWRIQPDPGTPLVPSESEPPIETPAS